MPSRHTDDAVPVALFDQRALHRLQHRQAHHATPAADSHAPGGPVVPVFDCQALQALHAQAVAATAVDVPPATAAVLVVDDDAAIRTLVESVLGEAGYEVLVAPDGEQALALVQARQPAVVLLDMNMPVMDGPTFCAALAAQHVRTRPAIVVMTASAETQTFRAQCAADDTLPKPFALDDLCAVVGRHAA